MLIINLRNQQSEYVQGDEVSGDVIYYQGGSPTGPPVRMLIELVGCAKSKVKLPDSRKYSANREQTDLLRVNGGLAYLDLEAGFSPKLQKVALWALMLHTNTNRKAQMCLTAHASRLMPRIT